MVAPPRLGGAGDLWLALAPDGPRHALRWALLVAAFFWAGPIWWVPRADRGLHESVWEIVVGDSFLWAMLSYRLGLLTGLPAGSAASPVEPAEVEASFAPSGGGAGRLEMTG